jgi:hypothetical protein
VRTLATVAVFCLAGFLSGYTFASYSAKVEKMYRALPRREVYPGDPVASDKSWHDANIAFGAYAGLKWQIFLLGFPVAMTAAMVLAKIGGHLRHIQLGRMIAGLLLTYHTPFIVFGLAAIAWPFSVIPCTVIAATLFAFWLTIISSKWSTLGFVGFLVSGAACLWVWWSLMQSRVPEDDANGMFLQLLEAIWGALFGLWLAIPKKPKTSAPALPPPLPPRVVQPAATPSA